MTWIHVSVPRSGTIGNCVALSRDENFRGANISEKMKKHYVHLHVDEPLENLVDLINPVYGAPVVVDGEESKVIRHKYRGYIDYAMRFPAATVAAIVNRDQEVEPDARVTYRKADFRERT